MLLCCADDARRSVLSFVLWVRGYDVIAGISALPPVPDCALVVVDRESEEMTLLIDHVLPELPIVAIGGSTRVEEFLDRVRIRVARKRGPKKRAPIFSPAVPAEGAPCLG